jgi:signal transduction histidine kinase
VPQLRGRTGNVIIQVTSGVPPVISVACSRRADSTKVVLGDASRLDRVVANLLTNALEYSPEDSPVTVRLWLESTAVVFDGVQ